MSLPVVQVIREHPARCDAVTRQRHPGLRENLRYLQQSQPLESGIVCGNQPGYALAVPEGLGVLGDRPAGSDSPWRQPFGENVPDGPRLAMKSPRRWLNQIGQPAGHDLLPASHQAQVHHGHRFPRLFRAGSGGVTLCSRRQRVMTDMYGCHGWDPDGAPIPSRRESDPRATPSPFVPQRVKILGVVPAPRTDWRPGAARAGNRHLESSSGRKSLRADYRAK